MVGLESAGVDAGGCLKYLKDGESSWEVTANKNRSVSVMCEVIL
jgi:hypothetical protein